MTPHFSLHELTFTQHRGLENTPSPLIAARLENILAPGLEKVREILGGHPIHVNSGFRSAAVNIAVGGTGNSAHCLGFAADIVCPGFGSPLEVCRALEAAMAARELRLDQLIFEYGEWTHVSFDPRFRGEVLTKLAGRPYRNGLPQAGKEPT